MSLGELPEKERRFKGVGSSTGAPTNDRVSKSAPLPDRVLANNRGLVIGTTGQKIMTLNPRRAYLFFQNRGTDTIYLAFGESVAGDVQRSNGIELAPGSVFEPNTNSRFMLCNDVYALADSDGQLLIAVEGSFTYG